jgi:mannose/fructose/N-acetylgalactosamine-specific phosphotransferase system component IID
VLAHYEQRPFLMAGLLAIGFALVAQGLTQQGLPVFWVVLIGTVVIAIVWYEQVYGVGYAHGRAAARDEAVAAEPAPPDGPGVLGDP